MAFDMWFKHFNVSNKVLYIFFHMSVPVESLEGYLKSYWPFVPYIHYRDDTLHWHIFLVETFPHIYLTNKLDIAVIGCCMRITLYPRLPMHTKCWWCHRLSKTIKCIYKRSEQELHFLIKLPSGVASAIFVNPGVVLLKIFTLPPPTTTSGPSKHTSAAKPRKVTATSKSLVSRKPKRT